MLVGVFGALFLAPLSAAGQTSAPRIPRMPDGKPNLTGLWQALGTAYWDIQDHIAQPGPFFQLGAIGAIPPGQGIVEGNEIPYQPWAGQKKKDNFVNRLTLDHMGKPREASVDTWMGTSNGHWEGDALVVDVTGLNGQSWLDRAGNFASENVHIVERYTLVDPDHLNYEATIEDKTVFTRPWKISLPLYRRKEKNAQITEFKCVEFAEELIYGNLRKQTK